MKVACEKGVPHSCVVCKSSVESYIQSRPLLRAQVAQYGLSESEVQPGDRVCNTCRCKSVRHRYKPSKQCPIPTCPAKKARVKRLRPFPAIWKDLSDEKRDAIMAKYQIPPTATKCCTACFNRINRRLSPNASLDTPDDPGSDTTRWTDDEIETMKKTLVEFGTDWRKLSEKINSKSDLQCRNFYFNFRKKYGLDALVQEYKKSKGGDGPPTLTDEEESGSTTSSCDETVAPSHDQSPRSSSNKNKDDYDSSATVSAEEGCGAEPEKQPNPGPEMRSMPMNSPTPLSLTVRHQQPASERNQGPPPSRIQSVAQHIHNQENGQQLSGTISLGSSHHSIVPQPQPPHATMSSLHPNHPLHSPQITASLALQQRSSPNIQVHPSQQQQQHPIYPTPVISHGSSQINHHNQGQPQGIPHHLSLHQARGLRYPSPEGPDGQEPPISVRVDDLMSATIERHLRRNPTTSSSVNSGTGQMHPGQSVSPTLQSILKSQPPPNAHHMISQIPQPGHLQHSGSNQGQLPQHQGQQGPPQHQQQQQGPPPQQQGPPPPQLVTAQVPTSSPHYPPHHGMNYGPKVDVRAMSQLQHHMVPREVSIVQLPPRDDCVTLDLSMKKRPASPNLPHQRPPSNGPPPAHQPLDYVSRGPPQGSPQDMYYAQKFSNPQRHPLQQPQLQRQQPQLVPPPPKQAKVPQPPALITKPPSLSPMKDGSITHGTPIHHTQQMSSKFEGLARPVSKEGSITQGTPKGPMYGMYERPPPAEYFKRMSPAGSPYYHGNPNAYYGQRPPSAGQRSPPHPPPQTSPFSADQHNSSRQIIINDYYTSQQMQPTQHPPQSTPSPLGQPRNVEQPKRTVNQPAGPGPMYMLPPRQEIPYRQSPPPSSIPPPTQHRQGVIQRATNRTVVKEEHGRYPQHDAFTSLVDVASSAPSLPVPKEENRRVCLPRVEMVRDGKSIVDMERSRVGPPMNQPNHPPPHQQSPHIYRPPPGTVTNQPSSDPIRVRGKEVYGREVQDSTLTAASLIDAIITHQINQPSPNDRSSPAPTNRTGDRLFASFQRSPAPQSSQGHGNPGNSQQGPHNLSIPNQVHSHGPPQHEEKVVVNDGRMNHKMPPGGGTTWGEQINLIISNDYASGKGSMPSSSGGMGGNPSHSSQHHGPPTSSPQMMNQNTHLSKKNNNEDEVMHYKSWKLRKALQLENEKQQQQQQMHVQQQQHPDERRIIRVHTEEPNMTNRPPSMPSRMSPEGHYQRSERGDPPPSMKSGPSIGPGGVPSFGRREGISLDYFNNLIMEKMRNENNEEMKSEDGNERKHDPASSVPTMNLPGGSASHMHVHNPATSSVHAHTHFGGLAGRIAAAARDDMRSSSDSQRSGDNQHFQLKMEKMDDEPSKGGDSDSPASMVIDESADIKEGKSQQPHNESGSSATATSQPNYEPLTDEEN
ncbi:unnamed protein product [Orchesella dallaii]|uniref:Nuclear receptor corepressor 1 n=1 Tax=Orchesella dallaii TaxID=48710 RepID=A0ABP1RUD4_9HEXA